MIGERGGLREGWEKKEKNKDEGEDYKPGKEDMEMNTEVEKRKEMERERKR